MFIKVRVTNKKIDDKKFFEQVLFFNKNFIRSMVIDENGELDENSVKILYEEKPNELSKYNIYSLKANEKTLKNGENFKVIKECDVGDKTCIKIIDLYIESGEYATLLMQLEKCYEF